MAERLLTREMAGSSVALALGDRLVVELPENGTTGYVWAVEQRPLSLELDGEVHGPASTSAVGAGGTASFSWTARAPGGGVLRLELRRPWETAPIERWEANVSVK